MIKDTTTEKYLQLDNIRVLQKGIPPLNKDKKANMVYYKDMQMYEIISRDLLKKRIKGTVMVRILKLTVFLEKFEKDWIDKKLH